MRDMNVRRLESRIINSSNHVKKHINNPKKDFAQVLESIQTKDVEIKFSKHASERLNSRNINLSVIELDKLKSAFNRAEGKGIEDALILMDDKAFIANIKNKTIVTTVNKEQLKESIFTNIDGAVII